MEIFPTAFGGNRKHRTLHMHEVYENLFCQIENVVNKEGKLFNIRNKKVGSVEFFVNQF